MGLENIAKEAANLLSVDIPVDRSSYHSLCKQVLELKILLLQLSRLLDWVSGTLKVISYAYADDNDVLINLFHDLTDIKPNMRRKTF